MPPTGLPRLHMSSRRVDCGLGEWSHSEATLPGLSAVVQLMWHFDGSMLRARERIFPGSAVEIIVHLGERYRDVEGDRVSICPATCVTGLRLGPAVIEAPRNRTAVLGIRLTVPGAYALFGRPMHDILGLTVDLHDLIGAAAVELHDACGAASGPHACFVSAAEWIAARLRRGTRPDPAVTWTLEQIRLSRGAAPISALRERIGFSRNRMAATFREQAGLTPKQFARIRSLPRDAGRSACPRRVPDRPGTRRGLLRSAAHGRRVQGAQRDDAGTVSPLASLSPQRQRRGVAASGKNFQDAEAGRAAESLPALEERSGKHDP